MDTKKILSNLDLALAGVAFVILIVVTFGGVIMRYILSSPLAWAEEVQLWMFLWITFLGAGAAFRYGSHVAVEIVYEILPVKVKHVMDYINYIIVMLILLYLMFLGFDLLALMAKIGKTTAILRIPTMFINAVIPICCLIMMVSFTYTNRALFKKGQWQKEHDAKAAELAAHNAAGAAIAAEEASANTSDKATADTNDSTTADKRI